VHQEALHRDADLAGMGEGTDGGPARRIGQVRPGIDDAGGVAPNSKMILFLPALPFKSQPTAALPVKERTFKRSSATAASAKRLTHGSTWSPPAGRPA